jgi:hypothetical protein
MAGGGVMLTKTLPVTVTVAFAETPQVSCHMNRRIQRLMCKITISAFARRSLGATPLVIAAYKCATPVMQDSAQPARPFLHLTPY